MSIDVGGIPTPSRLVVCISFRKALGTKSVSAARLRGILGQNSRSIEMALVVDLHAGYVSSFVFIELAPLDVVGSGSPSRKRLCLGWQKAFGAKRA
jgi:hypothetical protein